MEEYLLCMKTLRSQMNDVEDQAAKISVEEQTQFTTIQTLEKDLQLAHSDIKILEAETDQMVKAKGQICSQILEKKRKFSSLESDSTTLSQTLELIQQEQVSLSAKFVAKSTYYTNIMEDINAKLQQQQFIHFKDASGEQTREAEKGEHIREDEGKCRVESHTIAENVDDAVKKLVTMLESGKAKLDLATQTKSNLLTETSKVKQSVEQVKCRISGFKPELGSMNVKTLEEEHQALLADRAGETEYLHSLKQQFEKLKVVYNSPSAIKSHFTIMPELEFLRSLNVVVERNTRWKLLSVYRHHRACSQLFVTKEAAKSTQHPMDNKIDAST
ncbi:hypothetical protein RHGRI_005241 [Rhododendron griersonianum]|uniref:Uncharacterized protein n=1 Tax=Rhododendron griersonianum TaxID=479676 RepID=A0AAV6LDZ9_9ERIC|nr:hypothetical protein RHGRI_005241 [Rhododendron griersonianum]